MTTDPPPPLLPLPPGRAAAPVRLVRCPKCHVLLPELPNVPLYKCGGCGATLRAKIRKQPPPATVVEDAIATSIPDDRRNESSPCQAATKFTCTSRDDVNLCLTRPISHQLQSPQGCSDKEDQDTTAKHTTSSTEGQLDCRGRKQVSEEDNNRHSSPDAQFVSQGYIANSTTRRPTSDVVLSETQREEVSPDILLGDYYRPSSQSDSDKMEKERPTQEEGMHIPSSTELSNNHENELPEEEEEKLGARSLHAYDGSVSSSEGWDDQVHRHVIRKYTFEFDDTSGEQTRTDVSVNSETNAKAQLPLHPRRFQAMTLNDNLIKTKMGNNISLSRKPPADIRNATTAQEQLRSESFYTAQTSMQSQWTSEKDGSPSAYENGGPSTSYSNNESMYNSDSHPEEKAPSVEHGQDELLRKVDELRDQLCRSYAHKLETRDGERQMCSNQALRRQRDPNCYRRNDPWRLSGAYPPSNSVSFQGRDSSQIPTATNCRCRVDRTSLQCCPEQFQHPLQRPPIAKGCYSEQIYLTHPGYVCYHPCGSGPVIPSQFRNSNFAPRIGNSQPLAHGQKPLDHKAEKQSLYPHRDRRNHIKRHCLPIAGGAPIIICYSCMKLLHLPADFILSSNRCSRLRCSSCSEILIFRLRSGKSVPLRPNPLTIPPRSEVDSCSNSTGTSSLDFFVPRENRNRDESGETSRVNSRRMLLEKRLDGKEVRRSLHGLMGYSSPRRLIQGSDGSLEW